MTRTTKRTESFRRPPRDVAKLRAVNGWKLTKGLWGFPHSLPNTALTDGPIARAGKADPSAPECQTLAVLGLPSRYSSRTTGAPEVILTLLRSRLTLEALFLSHHFPFHYCHPIRDFRPV